MRAIYYDRTGPAAEVLTLGEMPDPHPSAGEVLVRIAASGINPADVKRRAGWGGLKMGHPRIIPHSDGAGTIDQAHYTIVTSRFGQVTPGNDTGLGLLIAHETAQARLSCPPQPIRGSAGRRGALGDRGLASCAAGRGSTTRPARPSALRQRNELAIIRGRELKAAIGPIALAPGLFGGLDPFLRRRHEIPPDVARSLERLAAQDHHPRTRRARRSSRPCRQGETPSSGPSRTHLPQFPPTRQTHRPRDLRGHPAKGSIAPGCSTASA